MMQSIFYATAYVRTSKDDPDSSSIENQIELIRGFAKSIPDIEIVSVREDNGYTGIDFLRPDFGEMMKDIEAGTVNCVIVKDLSRLGRNYIELGEFMDEVFPRYNVRLISINDNYDSINPRSDADEILIPFRNLINEQYARDASGKIRVILNKKREDGAFVGAFAPYGYKRAVDNKHQLVIDERAAQIVRNIFNNKLEGMSQHRIAEQLNALGEPSPAEYKKRNTNYVAQFQTRARASWSAVAIGRILRNPVYVGILVQGKQTTPNYKVKQRIDRAEDEWSIVYSAHEPIISKNDFAVVNGLLRQDTRTAPSMETVYPLSGLIYCADCGNNMVRTKSGVVTYYVCASSRGKKKTCTTHSIQEKRLLETVLETINSQIRHVLDMESSLSLARSFLTKSKDATNLNKLLADREQEIKDCERYKRSLYEDYKSGLISKEDYILFGKDYAARIDELRTGVNKLNNEIQLLFGDTVDSPINKWLAMFVPDKHVESLSRPLAVTVIERIEVFTGKRVEVRFRNYDKVEATEDILNSILAERRGEHNAQG